MSLRHPVGGCLFGFYGEHNSRIRKASCRDVSWRGLVGTWHLIHDWIYLLTFLATGLALRIVFLGYRPIRKLTSIRRLNCPISGRRGKNGGGQDDSGEATCPIWNRTCKSKTSEFKSRILLWFGDQILMLCRKDWKNKLSRQKDQKTVGIYHMYIYVYIRAHKLVTKLSFWKERGRGWGREGGREGRSEGGMERGREGGTEGRREGGRNGGR